MGYVLKNKLELNGFVGICFVEQNGFVEWFCRASGWMLLLIIMFCAEMVNRCKQDEINDAILTFIYQWV